MIIGFFGKGGSGKSSVSTQVALWLHQQDKEVLAVDADHNMDLSFNLFKGELPEDIAYFGSKLQEINQYVGLEEGQKYSEVFFKEASNTFSVEPKDRMTQELTTEVTKKLNVMVAGPQTDTVLYGKSCSHILTTPLKVYLPLLEVQDDQWVVIDEKAGADGVTTGIVTGIDVGVIICEPAKHSIKTAKQIAELMDFYETPYVFVGNKVQSSDDKDFITEELGQEPVTYLLESKNIKRNPGVIISEWEDEIETVIEKAKVLSKNDRLERTKIKFERNKAFQE